MMTPEIQKIIDDLKAQLKAKEDENAELKRQIAEAKEAAEEAGEDALFEGIFD